MEYKYCAFCNLEIMPDENHVTQKGIYAHESCWERHIGIDTVKRDKAIAELKILADKLKQLESKQNSTEE